MRFLIFATTISASILIIFFGSFIPIILTEIDAVTQGTLRALAVIMCSQSVITFLSVCLVHADVESVHVYGKEQVRVCICIADMVYRVCRIAKHCLLCECFLMR